ncbi:hypothetical protein SCB49_01884 [unidentified eubacterium SCB49]|nr:hypothetical protein SCB49_01884 [unidentified eubacterium SCB49]
MLCVIFVWFGNVQDLQEFIEKELYWFYAISTMIND